MPVLLKLFYYPEGLPSTSVNDMLPREAFESPPLQGFKNRVDVPLQDMV